MSNDTIKSPKKWQPKPLSGKNKSQLKKTGFLKDDSGVAAIEFAMLGLPFFLILFSVMEIAMVFFGNTNIEYATREAARLIRTGQAQTGVDFAREDDDGDGSPNTGNITASEFKNLVCDKMFIVSNCKSKIHIQVKTFDDWGDVDADALSLPITTGGVHDASIHNEFEQPGSCKITVVRSFIERTLIAQIPGIGVSNLSNGNLLQVGSAIFQTEPYSGACS